MKHSIMFKSKKFLNNNGLCSALIYSKMAVVLISRQVSPIVQIVRTIRATPVTLSSEIGRWHSGRFAKLNMAYGKSHESVIDSSLRTDKKASHSQTTLTTKSYAHKVDPAVSETAVLSETTLAKGGKGVQYFTWKDYGKTRVTQYQVKNNFQTRRQTTPEEDKNFQDSKRVENNPKPVYRRDGITPEIRFCQPSEIKKPTTLAEKEAGKFKKNTKKNAVDKKEKSEKTEENEKNDGNN